ncbi:MAG: RNA polymerase sigma-54 factor [Deltaproteobacteria bacterium]|nr:MAG: RNA polymerase sigma-54 factor [Deltaproteobacteria bacterium]
MALELKQHLKMAQQLIMTPQLQQAIKLLQLSRLELKEYIAQEVEANPLLEIDTNAADAKIKGPEDADPDMQMEWDAYLDTYGQDSIPYYGEEDRPSIDATVSKREGLSDYLLWQLRMNNFSHEECMIGLAIIGNLDTKGYLKADIESISEDTGVSEDKVLSVLKKVQTFDPPGIAARDLRECLLIQARALGLEGTIVWKIIDKYLEDLQTKNFDKIAQGLNVRVQEVSYAADIISTMEPRPARNYSDEPPQYIIPDIYVFKINQNYVVVLNEDDLPPLKLNENYQHLLQSDTTGKMTKDYLAEHMRSAQWLIKSIEQRRNTLCKVTASIVKFQRDFLDHGISHLKPLVLRDVAEDVGMHESTISRVTSNKYVHTPQGIFELKFFFNSGFAKSDGGFVASESVKNEIEKLIKSEDPRHPLSDQAISTKLEEKGIKIARRTVAKYREMLGILPSNRRKKHY